MSKEKNIVAENRYSIGQYILAIAKAINNVIIIPVLLIYITGNFLSGVGWIVFTGFVYDAVFPQNEDKKINADAFKLLLLSVIFVAFMLSVAVDIVLTYF